MGWALRLTVTALAGAVAVAGAGYWAVTRVAAPGPLTEETIVLIPRGAGVESIGSRLFEAGVIEHPYLFYFGSKLRDASRGLKAGEYAFASGISIDGVLEQMGQGRTLVRRVTVPEGLTSTQIVALLAAEDKLTGDIADIPPEGTLLPETYHYSYGDNRAAILERMRHSMTVAVNELWEKRAEGLPFKTPQEAVILASIVEKETGVAAERAKVAGVFVNRLESGMRLQSDPTVIYALTEGKRDLGRSLTRADWRFESDYNTYVTAALPPGPIANPGRASLQATLQPESHKYIYFVADGSGGHAFATSLADHNRNVAKWRAVQRTPNGD